MRYGNRYFRCWKRDGHGSPTLGEAIAQSCDVYFYQLGLRLGLANILSEGTVMGFGSRTGIDLPFEALPTFPTSTEYFDERYGPRGWTNAVTLNLAIGQGENDQTLINMVRFFAMLAGDGRSVTPHLVRSETVDRRTLQVSREQLADLREALVSVVREGTAQRIWLDRLSMAGKTGTAQNAHGLDHGWFVGFAPAQAPQIVVGVIVEFAEHGSWVAPIASQIMAYHVLGPDVARTLPYHRFIVPADTAPRPTDVVPTRPDSAISGG